MVYVNEATLIRNLYFSGASLAGALGLGNGPSLPDRIFRHVTPAVFPGVTGKFFAGLMLF
jgi:hypothetical protein